MSKASKVKGPIPLNIPVHHGELSQEVLNTNRSLEATLRKRKHAEIHYYNLPGVHNDIFRRRIIVTKADAKQTDLSDAPDVEDCYATNLPWTGFTSFRHASRQFRARNALGVVVEVVREFEGYLYLICDDQIRPDHLPSPALMVLQKRSIQDGYHHLEITRELTTTVMAQHFGDAPVVPGVLIEELTSIGYVQDGALFTAPHEGMGKIYVALYGKIVKEQDLNQGDGMDASEYVDMSKLTPAIKRPELACA